MKKTHVVLSKREYNKTMHLYNGLIVTSFLLKKHAFEKALLQLDKALKEPESEFMRDARYSVLNSPMNSHGKH